MEWVVRMRTEENWVKTWSRQTEAFDGATRNYINNNEKNRTNRTGTHKSVVRHATGECKRTTIDAIQKCVCVCTTKKMLWLEMDRQTGERTNEENMSSQRKIRNENQLSCIVHRRRIVRGPRLACFSHCRVLPFLRCDFVPFDWLVALLKRFYIRQNFNWKWPSVAATPTARSNIGHSDHTRVEKASAPVQNTWMSSAFADFGVYLSSYAFSWACANAYTALQLRLVAWRQLVFSLVSFKSGIEP